jgi:hypothetical protein
MSQDQNSPFSSPEEAAKNMVELLAQEGEKAGTPLTDREKELLLQTRSDSLYSLSDSEELRQKAKALISRIFEAESPEEFDRGPRSFSDSMLWAGDAAHPNIVALAEEVCRDIRKMGYPPLRGWKWAKDHMQLVGCGCLVVLAMFVMITIAGIVNHWK